MELNRLEKYKREYSFFNNQIESLKTYLARIDSSKVSSISTEAASSFLKIPEIDVIFLLSLAEKEHLVHKKFLVFTKSDHSLIGEFDDNQKIPKLIRNDNTGKDVDQENFYIDIVFEVEK